MRRALALSLALSAALAATPAAAWQAGSDGRVCTLTHSAPEAEVLLTYDPAGPLYTITVTLPEPWPVHPVFAIAFEGGRALQIATDRHERSADGRSITVTDRGFGNVLDGLAQNRVAVIVQGPRAVPVSLAGAAPEVAIFRNCGALPAV
jgi:hypothetical protein